MVFILQEQQKNNNQQIDIPEQRAYIGHFSQPRETYSQILINNIDLKEY